MYVFIALSGLYQWQCTPRKLTDFLSRNRSRLTTLGLASSGSLTLLDDANTSVAYEYNVLDDTLNVYSIQLFTKSSEFSFEGEPLTRDFQKFVDYYGEIAYFSCLWLASC